VNGTTELILDGALGSFIGACWAFSYKFGTVAAALRRIADHFNKDDQP